MNIAGEGTVVTPFGVMGGNDGDLRSKTRTIEGPIRSLADSK